MSGKDEKKRIPEIGEVMVLSVPKNRYVGTENGKPIFKEVHTDQMYVWDGANWRRTVESYQEEEYSEWR